MKYVTCEIIRDLLPLYCDGVCSEESRELIRTHLHGCDKCREELRLISLPVHVAQDAIETDAAQAAAKAWKRNKQKAFRMGMGITLALLLLVGLLVLGAFLGRHYRNSCADGDWDGLRDMLAAEEAQMNQIEASSRKDDVYTENAQLGRVEISARKGGYLAIACPDGEGRWHVGIFVPDSVFSNRWVYVGGLGGVRPGKLAGWNYNVNGVDTVLVCFGAELPEEITGYMFTNSGVTYICPVEAYSVLDFFFVPDTYDTDTHLMPIYDP